MLDVIDKRKPLTKFISNLEYGDKFIIEENPENIIIGMVLQEVHINADDDFRDYTPYVILNGTESGAIRFRAGDCIVTPVSLKAHIVNYEI